MLLDWPQLLLKPLTTVRQSSRYNSFSWTYIRLLHTVCISVSYLRGKSQEPVPSEVIAFVQTWFGTSQMVTFLEWPPTLILLPFLTCCYAVHTHSFIILLGDLPFQTDFPVQLLMVLNPQHRGNILQRVRLSFPLGKVIVGTTPTNRLFLKQHHVERVTSNVFFS